MVRLFEGNFLGQPQRSCSGIADFTSISLATLTYEPGQSPRDLLLRPGPIIELTVGTKDIQRRLDPFPNRFPLLIQFESLKRLRPSLVDLLRQLSLGYGPAVGPV